MLIHYFSNVVEQLKEESRFCRYNAPFPNCTTVWQQKLKTEDRIPVSLIAQQLYQTIEENINKNIIHIGNDIIEAFKLIYNKYVDAQDAIFMINISSRKRNSLMNLLDCEYYYREVQKPNFVRRLTDTIAKNGGDQDKDTCWLNAQWLEYCKNNKEKDRNDKIKWILKSLFTSIEPSVYEIEKFLHSAFRRYENKYS